MGSAATPRGPGRRSVTSNASSRSASAAAVSTARASAHVPTRMTVLVPGSHCAVRQLTKSQELRKPALHAGSGGVYRLSGLPAWTHFPFEPTTLLERPAEPAINEHTRIGGMGSGAMCRCQNGSPAESGCGSRFRARRSRSGLIKPVSVQSPIPIIEDPKWRADAGKQDARAATQLATRKRAQGASASRPCTSGALASPPVACVVTVLVTRLRSASVGPRRSRKSRTRTARSHALNGKKNGHSAGPSICLAPKRMCGDRRARAMDAVMTCLWSAPSGADGPDEQAHRGDEQAHRGGAQASERVALSARGATRPRSEMRVCERGLTAAHSMPAASYLLPRCVCDAAVPWLRRMPFRGMLPTTGRTRRFLIGNALLCAHRRARRTMKGEIWRGTVQRTVPAQRVPKRRIELTPKEQFIRKALA
ncbi:hypothetical protein WOLCODRAFT_149100 [Wolfiporia cocos MD-104 SS10]|uniref:Uncharacterized protein n=1 Tax=Wolfiporia cocos (strain MD-104) TaxID=742152 RepID=A0A2H3J7C8_WOLCO|nr:hypothetical protein WOLCODRAFT_149100 [Wolfiporia cocos MD-104 SS10]